MGDTNRKAACMAESGMNKGFHEELQGVFVSMEQKSQCALFIRHDGIFGKNNMLLDRKRRSLAACLPGSIACTIPAMKNLKSAVLRTILLAGMLWLPFAAYAAKNILVFGDSLSAGYGIAAEQSWPHLLQQELKTAHPGYDIVNASISGETSLGGRKRIARALRQHRPVIVIVALGTNDGLRGYRIADIEANLEDIVTKARRAGARVLLAGVKLPPNYGRPYTVEFEKVFSRLAKRHRAALLPFLLDGVAPEQFLPDNLHPAAEAQPRIMRNVLQKLAPMLK